MNSYGYGQQPESGGWGRYRLIIALLLGVVLGALLVGQIGGQRWFMGGRGDRMGMQQRQGVILSAPQQSQPIAPDTLQQRSTDPRGQMAQQPHGGDRRGWAGARTEYGPRHGRHGGFFLFGPFRLLASLLLIGAGAWLIWGKRRGPGSNGGGASTPPQPVASVEPVAPTTAPDDRPETGETRML